MYGELGGELIRELARSKNDVPAYDDTSVREIIDETINITQKNQEALNSTALQQITEDHDFENIPDEDRTVYTNWCIRYNDKNMVLKYIELNKTYRRLLQSRAVGPYKATHLFILGARKTPI